MGDGKSVFLQRARALIHKGRIVVEKHQNFPDRTLEKGCVRVQESPTPSSKLLTKAETAEYLGTSERHIERLWATRQIAAIHVGRKIRWRVEDLDAFCEANRTAAVR